MNINSKLFQKSIDLKKSDIYGGRADETEKICRTYEYAEECTYITITYYNDQDEYQTRITITDCPD